MNRRLVLSALLSLSATFGSSFAVAGTTALLAPEGQIQTTAPTFQWQGQPNSNWYHLKVTDDEGAEVINEWYSIWSAGCYSAQDVCEVDARKELEGQFTWQVRAYKWSYPQTSWGTGLNFSYGDVQQDGDLLAYFADEHDPDNRLLVMDTDTMELVQAIPVDGSLNHHADAVGSVQDATNVFLVPKGSQFLNVLDIQSRDLVKQIQLPFKPRSADAYNKEKGLVVLTAANQPAAVLIDVNTLDIAGEAGLDISCDVDAPPAANDLNLMTCLAEDFGGQQISGHPYWLSNDVFAIVDRSNRKIHTYKLGEDDNGYYHPSKTGEVSTPSSMHQIVPRDLSKVSGYEKNFFYGILEGNQQTAQRPGVVRMKFENDRLRIVKTKYLDKRATNQGISGGHNSDFHPDQRHLYVGVASGKVFVVDTKRMRVVSRIKASPGSGHTTFMKGRDLAVVTNHLSDTMTMVNTKTHRKVADITLPFNSEGIFTAKQSHTGYSSEDGRYYYNFWTDGGVFFRIDMDTMSLDPNYTYVGGIPIQGNYFRVK